MWNEDKIHSSNLSEKRDLRTSSKHQAYFPDLDPPAMLHQADHLREARVTGEQISSLSAPYSPEEQSWDQNNLVSE